ncbi:dynamin family protein [Nocardioides baekrokdamisoli]|nr:dynamin family protein [Nocardioides baekrokdamisoli]
MSSDNVRMVTELVRLHQALRATSLPLASEGVEALRASRVSMIDQLQDYVIPRVMTMDAPLLTVVGGSTGAGKSTLVNSLVGERVTAPGLLRPTTRCPVLVHHPDDAKWFGQDRLLPGLRRTTEASNDQYSIQLVATKKMKRGLAVLDAPDVDSVDERNRELAAELLNCADLWLFVTSSARYADQVPWDSLKSAAERSAAVAVVLDRTPEDAIQTVSTHLARMLAARGLKDSPLFIVRNGKVSDEGLLPKGHVSEIATWLAALADDAITRNLVVSQTVDGAVRAISFTAHKVADAAAVQAAVAERLAQAAADAYAQGENSVEAALDAGVLARGDAGARWHDFVTSGNFTESLTSTDGALRAGQIRTGLGLTLELLLVRHAEAAAEATSTGWNGIPEGADLLALPGAESLSRASRGLRAATSQAVAAWQAAVEADVRAEGGSDAAAVAAMVGALGGADQDSTDVLGDAVGPTAAASLIEGAGQRLRQGVHGLLESEHRRYATVLGGLGLDPEAPAAVRAAARRVDDVRWATKNETN